MPRTPGLTTRPVVRPAPTERNPPGRPLPSLWPKLDPERRAQLASQLAQLIRRIRQPRHLTKEDDHDRD